MTDAKPLSQPARPDIPFGVYERHHFYHHNPRGMHRGGGLTNGFREIVFKTHFLSWFGGAL